MTQYFEYKVKLSDNQKRSLAKAINSKLPLTLRIKSENLVGNDELMLTTTQMKNIQKSLGNGTGADIKISKTQIRKVISETWRKSFLITCQLGSKSITICCKRINKSCTRFGYWCCFCFR